MPILGIEQSAYCKQAEIVKRGKGDTNGQNWQWQRGIGFAEAMQFKAARSPNKRCGSLALCRNGSVFMTLARTMKFASWIGLWKSGREGESTVVDGKSLS